MPWMSEAADSDEALMLRYAAGDALAFEMLYRRHELKVWRYIYRSVCNRATADELMQDVWFAVVRQAGKYQPTARFTTWVFTLAHNRMIDSYRTTKPNRSLDELITDAEEWVEQLAVDARLNPLQQAESRQEVATMLAAVEQLPPEQKQAFLLQAEGELSVEEIAAATGVNFETVKSRLRYARTKLQHLLREYA